MTSYQNKGLMLASSLALLAGASAAAAEELNLYTTREPGLMQPLIDAYTKETGVTINTIFLKDGLAERVKAEGASSPADVLMTVDAGALVDLVEQGLTQGVASPVLEEAVPATLRDDEGHWYGLSVRARAIYAAKDLDLTEINYEDLADPKWKGKVCIRSGLHPYNVALTGSYMAHHGEEKTLAWLTGLKDNLARPAGGGDRDVARDIAGGLCDIGVANSYYVGLMKTGKGGPEQQAWSNEIKMILPEFENGGTQVNITGAAVAKNAPNKDAAVKFMEYLVSDDAQAIYAQANYEYPVNGKATVDPVIAEYGVLVPDSVDIVEGVKFRKDATALTERVAFDN